METKFDHIADPYAMQVNSLTRLNAVVFKDKASASISSRFFSLFPGLGYAAAYKVGVTYSEIVHQTDIWKIMQRIYKYGGQPFVRDYLAKHHGDSFDRQFGKGTGKAVMHASAGRYNLRGPVKDLPILTITVSLESVK